MTTTAQHEVADDDWTEVADGSARVIVQLISNGVVGIAAGATAPEGDYWSGIILRTKFMALPLYDLGASDKVFVRGANGSEIVNVIAT